MPLIPLTLTPRPAHRLNYRDVVRGLRALGLGAGNRVLFHTQLDPLVQIGGDAHVVLGALLAESGLLMMPGFTYQTMVYPLVGPPDNGVEYGQPVDNSYAQFWQPDLPVHPDLGPVAELFRQALQPDYSYHPVLRFLACGPEARAALATQTLDEPFGPIDWMAAHGGQVLLLGVGHEENISLHYAAQLAGHKAFTRWALAGNRVVTLPNYPAGDGQYEALEARLNAITRQTQLRGVTARLLPLAQMLEIARQALSQTA